VSLSSVIIERVDSGFILMNSFFFKVMDSIERTLPSLIPEPLKDESPSMKRIEIPEAKKVDSHD
jgi:nitrous oxidase accessory protein